jgi:hypothetical protein
VAGPAVGAVNEHHLADASIAPIQIHGPRFASGANLFPQLDLLIVTAGVNHAHAHEFHLRLEHLQLDGLEDAFAGADADLVAVSLLARLFLAEAFPVARLVAGVRRCERQAEGQNPG